MKRIATAVGGFGLLLAGLVLMVLPGPGIPLVVAGLGLLSTQYTWARRLREWVQRRAQPVTPKKRSHRIALGVLAAAAAVAALVVAAVVGVPGF